jgi:cytochrome c peroxidase
LINKKIEKMYLSILKRRLDYIGLLAHILFKMSFGTILLLTLSGCFSSHDSSHNDTKTSTQLSESLDSSSSPIRPLPQNVTLDPKRVALGKALFHDTRLSKDNSISCASCHSLNKGGTDNLPHSIGINGAVGDINAPTVLNSGFNFVQFWDGRAKSLEEQAVGPVHSPIEMGSSWVEVIMKLSSDKWFVDQFRKLYSDGMTGTNIQDAIATYERALITPNSLFDQFLRGDETAMSDEAIEGYYFFIDYGCASCHQGVNIGGNMFQRLGVMEDYFKDRGNITTADYGRFNVTGRESDRFKFKVPSLRNIAETAPYFHDGSAATLQEAIKVMMHYQIGTPVSEKHLEYLVAFLESLTGELEVSLK